MPVNIKKSKLNIRNVQISQGTGLSPWEFRNREYREKALPLVETYFFRMFSERHRFSISLENGAKDLGISPATFLFMMKNLEYRENLIVKGARRNPGDKQNVYFCTKRGKRLVEAIRDNLKKGTRIPKNLKLKFALIGSSLKVF